MGTLKKYIFKFKFHVVKKRMFLYSCCIIACVINRLMPYLQYRLTFLFHGVIMTKEIIIVAK